MTGRWVNVACVAILAGCLGSEADHTKAPEPTPTHTVEHSYAGLRFVQDSIQVTQAGEAGMRETVVAVNPSNGSNILTLVTDRNSANETVMYANRAFYTLDRGRSWRDAGPVAPPELGRSVTGTGDPSVVWTPNGTAFLIELVQPNLGVWLFRSDDQARTWKTVSRAVREEGCLNADKPWLARHPVAGTLYLAFTDQGCGQALSDFRLLLQQSDDDGHTWSAPVELARGFVIGGIPAVGSDGTLYVAYHSSVTTPISPCPWSSGALFGQKMFSAIVVANSRDGGTTWSRSTFAQCRPDTANNFYGGAFLPALAIDASDNRPHLAYADFSPTVQRYRIMHAVGTAGGRAWSTPKSITAATEDCFEPALETDAGRVWVLHYSLKDGVVLPRITGSQDSGSSWKEPLVLAAKASRVENDFSDYIGLDYAAGVLAATWTEAHDQKAAQLFSRIASDGS